MKKNAGKKLELAMALTQLFLLQSVSSDVCTTPGCRKASTEVLSFIDPSIDPCEDFYKFTCSGIFRKTQESKPVSLAAMAEKEAEDQINIMLIKPINPKEPMAIQGLKKFFRSCMDEAAIERDGVNSIKRVLRQIGGWPVIEGDKWKEDRFNAEELMIKLRRMGYNFKQLLNIKVTPGDKEQKYAIYMPDVEKVLPKDKENYHDVMTQTAVLLGADNQTASSEMQETLMFKMNLQNVIEGTDMSDKRTIRSVQEDFPFINWNRFINNIIFPNKFLSEDQEMYFPAQEHLTAFSNLLKETSNRTLANYLLWEAVAEVRPYLPKKFRELTGRYMLSDIEEEENQTRLAFCKTKSQDILRPTLEAMYVKEYFPSKRREKAQELVSSIKAELVELINSTDLLDDETRTKMLAKSDEIHYNIGAPDRLFDEKIFAQLFDETETIHTNEFLTVASILNRKSANLALNPKDKIDFYGSLYENSLVAKPIYADYERTMTLPAAALQGLYFNEKRPWYLNFGAMGTVFGHELAHSFVQDVSNSKNGSQTLWTSTTKPNFRNRAACLIHDANNFKIENSELHMNGEQVLDENICDHTGVELAYRAYDNWVKMHGDEKQLPGLNYSPRQLFWISVGSSFCDTVSLDDLGDFVQNERTAHPAFRTWAAISNNEHFGVDFNCPVRARMNPSDKCKIF